MDVGLNSSSKYLASWLCHGSASRLRPDSGWLVEDGIHQLRLFRAPIWSPSGGGGTQETGGTVTESLLGSSDTCKRTVARTIG